MKKFLVGLVMLLVVGSVSAIEVDFNFPNLEVPNIFYDMVEEESSIGFTLHFISIGDFEGRFGNRKINPDGALSKKWILSATYNIKNLEKLGAVVEYKLGEADLIIGAYISRDFEKNINTWGLQLITYVIKIKK